MENFCVHQRTDSCLICGFHTVDGQKIDLHKLVDSGATTDSQRKFVKFMAGEKDSIIFFFHNEKLVVPNGQGNPASLVIYHKWRTWEYQQTTIDAQNIVITTLEDHVQAALSWFEKEYLNEDEQLVQLPWVGEAKKTLGVLRKAVKLIKRHIKDMK